MLRFKTNHCKILCASSSLVNFSVVRAICVSDQINVSSDVIDVIKVVRKLSHLV